MSESDFTLTYINIGMPCDAIKCKTNKSTWFILTQEMGDKYRQMTICDDCAYEVDKTMNWKLYKSIVDYTIEMEFQWPSDWVSISDRIGDYKE